MSVKVIIIKDDKPVEQFAITKDVTTVGRKSDCDISIKDPAVSGNHARIQRVRGDLIIQDLGSTNGLVIRGRKVKQQALKNDDLVTVGEHQLKFVISQTAQASGTQVKARASASPAAEPAGSYLTVHSGSNAGNKIQLDEGLTTIGEPGVQVAAVSKRPQGHFIIHVDGGKDKSRVPLVNGEPIGFKSKQLEAGDRIEVAGIQMEYVAN